MKRIMWVILCVTIMVVITISCVSHPPVTRGKRSSTRSSVAKRASTKSSNSINNSTVDETNNSIGGGVNSSQDRVLSGSEIFKRCNSAVFMIFTSDGNVGYQGSGFFISNDGVAVSNYHVFKGTGRGLETIKLVDGRTFKVDKVLYSDRENDLIIFHVRNLEGTVFNYIPISTHSVQVGDKVYAIGSPLGLENTFASGEVSQLRENNLIQISVPIDHGSSGGVLLNTYGEAIGITSSGYDDSIANLNFAIDISLIRDYFK